MYVLRHQSHQLEYSGLCDISVKLKLLNARHVWQILAASSFSGLGKDSDMNGSIWLLVFSVSVQLASFDLCLECPNSLHFNLFIDFNIRQTLYCGFWWTTGHLVLYFHPLGSWMRLMLGSIDAVLYCIRPLILLVLELRRLVWLVIDLMVLLFTDFTCGCLSLLLKTFLFSEKRHCWMALFDLLQHPAAFSRFAISRFSF